MLNLMRDYFDENADDLLNSINKMLEKNRKNSEETNEETEVKKEERN